MTILANIIFLIYHPGWFRSIMQIILNILGFMVCYYLYTIFPFIFSNAAYTIALKILLILGMAGVIIASIVEVFRLILRLLKHL
jgi:glycopeptide antibiotics resistance protein